MSAICRRGKLQKIQELWFRNRQRSFLIGKNDSSKISNKKKKELWKVLISLEMKLVKVNQSKIAFK